MTEQIFGQSRQATRTERQILSELNAYQEALAVYAHLLDVNGAERQLHKIYKLVQGLREEPGETPAPNLVHGPTLEQLMEAPAGSVLHAEGPYTKQEATKMNDGRWAVQGIIGGSWQIAGYYYAEELAGISERTLEYPKKVAWVQ